eukprot:scaffold165037_cov37-Tisochrysis_lutea.AAC.1
MSSYRPRDKGHPIDKRRAWDTQVPSCQPLSTLIYSFSYRYKYSYQLPTTKAQASTFTKESGEGHLALIVASSAPVG